MLLKDKVAVVYGAAGGVGGAVARTFAREGAKVYQTGRRRSADIAEVDALDEHAIESHLESVIDEAGRIDISFNAIGIPNEAIIGKPFVDLEIDHFYLPIESYARSYFLTARAAARRMIPNKSGVIMTVSALLSRRGTLLNGGYGSAQAAKEALTRDLSAELAPAGIRVVTLRPHGMLETRTMREFFSIKAAETMNWEQFATYLAGGTHTQRVMKLEEVAEVAAFVASDKASGLTGTSINLTMGSLDD